MSQQRKLFHGLAPMSLWEVLSDHARQMPVFRSAIIRSVDSTKSVEGLMDILRWHGLRAELVSGNVLVDRTEFEEAVKESMFTGFDEVWFLRGDGVDREIPSSLRLTSDATDFAENVPSGLAPLMVAVNCCLAVGDGAGLNYATDDEQFARLLGKDASAKGTIDVEVE